MRWLATIILGALVVALGACQTMQKAPPAPATPPTAPAIVVRLQCLPLVDYKPAAQAQAAAEMRALPPGSELGKMMVDYHALREALRACQRSASGG